MFVKIEKNELLNGISTAMRAVSFSKNQPILGCLLMEVSNDGVKLIGNNLEMSIETAKIATNPSMDQVAGKIALDAKVFSDIVRSLPDGEIQISTDAKHLVVIKSGKSEFKILGVNPKDFPEIKNITPAGSFVIENATLRDMIRKTIFCVSQDNAKPVLMGALVRVSGGQSIEGADEQADDVSDEKSAKQLGGIVEMCTVDGFRISHIQSKIDYDGNDISIIIPGKTLSEISKMLPTAKNSKVTVYFDNKRIWLFFEGTKVMSRLIDGEFINFENMFGIESTSLARVDRAELLSAIERATLIGERKTPVVLNVDDSFIYISSRTEMGSMDEEVAIDSQGAKIIICFNPTYLADFLKSTNADQVEMSFASPLSPCIIRPVDDDNSKYLVLPLRINNATASATAASSPTRASKSSDTVSDVEPKDDTEQKQKESKVDDTRIVAVADETVADEANEAETTEDERIAA